MNENPGTLDMLAFEFLCVYAARTEVMSRQPAWRCYVMSYRVRFVCRFDVTSASLNCWHR